jgi:hypothetical protein
VVAFLLPILAGIGRFLLTPVGAALGGTVAGGWAASSGAGATAGGSGAQSSGSSIPWGLLIGVGAGLVVLYLILSKPSSSGSSSRY